MAMKVAVGAYGPIVVVWVRLIIASLLFAPYLRGFRQRIKKPGDLKWLVLMALFEPCLYFLFEGYALKLTTSAQAGTVAAMLPLMMAAGAHYVLGEHVARKTLIGFSMAIVGVILLSLGGEATESAPNPILGNFLEFMAMVSATGYMLSLKTLSGRYTTWFLTAVQAFVGALFFVPLGLWALPDAAAQAAAQPDLLLPGLAVLYLGTAITAGAYGLYNYGMGKLPANLAAGYINLIPVVAVLLGWLLLGETFTALQWAAAALVLAGVFVSQSANGSAK